MSLTTEEIEALRIVVLAEASLAAARQNGDDQAIANWLNADASPDFIVWRTSVTEQEYTETKSAENTNWSWPAFIARSPGEQAGWDRMFRSGSVNPSRSAVQQGFQDIFSGTQNSAPAQRTHLQAISKRKANRAEKVLATGTGTLVSPATLTFYGSVSLHEASKMR